MNVQSSAIWNRGHDPTTTEFLLEHRKINHLPAVDQTVSENLQLREKITTVVNDAGKLVSPYLLRSAYRSQSHFSRSSRSLWPRSTARSRALLSLASRTDESAPRRRSSLTESRQPNQAAFIKGVMLSSLRAFGSAPASMRARTQFS